MAVENEKSFGVSLLFYIRSPENRRRVQHHLAELSDGTMGSELFDSYFNFVVHLVSDEKSLAERAVELLYLNGSPRAVVVVSDSLVERGPNGLGMSRAGDVIAQTLFVHGMPAAFISLSDEPEAIGSLVAQIGTRALDIPRLRQAIETAAMRVRLLSSDNHQRAWPLSKSGRRFHFHLVQRPEQLLSCFELRYSIYDILGYLSPEVRGAGLGIELDFHDGMSLHYAAVDAETGEVAATIRLVIPHQPWGVAGSVAPELRDAFREQQSWFRAVAEGISAPALQRKLLESGVGALPMLQNACVERRWNAFIAQGLNGVELSRSVVNPKYRGIGLSRALTQLSLAGAYDLGRRAVFGECLPNHVEMYRQYGFAEIEGKVAAIQKWGDFFMTPQKLLLEMGSPGNARRLQAVRWSSALFKLANPNIARPLVATGSPVGPERGDLREGNTL